MRTLLNVLALVGFVVVVLVSISVVFLVRDALALRALNRRDALTKEQP